jgi:hypothetical protein
MAERIAERTVKREYFPPQIVHTETITARATVCAKASTSCLPGPIQS